VLPEVGDHLDKRDVPASDEVMDAGTFSCGGPSPHAVVLWLAQRVLEALDPDRASSAYPPHLGELPGGEPWAVLCAEVVDGVVVLAGGLLGPLVRGERATGAPIGVLVLSGIEDLLGADPAPLVDVHTLRYRRTEVYAQIT
jgi:hypothetical protein